jgi:hypothetical protein
VPSRFFFLWRFDGTRSVCAGGGSAQVAPCLFPPQTVKTNLSRVPRFDAACGMDAVSSSQRRPVRACPFPHARPPFAGGVAMPSLAPRATVCVGSAACPRRRCVGASRLLRTGAVRGGALRVEERTRVVVGSRRRTRRHSSRRVPGGPLGPPCERASGMWPSIRMRLQGCRRGRGSILRGTRSTGSLRRTLHRPRWP